MSSICIDGFNLALAKGSGIATYGRNLLINVREIGLGTQVLYGPAAARKASNVVNETALTDAERPPEKLNRKKKIQRFRDTYTSRFGHEAHAIMPSGEVIWPSRGGGRPAADSFWAAQNLFHTANRSFAAYGKETPVSFEASADAPRPDAMHWTATLPLYAKGVPNLYTIHDLIPLRLPHTTMDDKAVYMRLCQAVAKRADHIAVVSETTRQDVVRLLGLSEDRVTNTYRAGDVPRGLTPRSRAEGALEWDGAANLGCRDSCLRCGAIERKKNLGRIVEA